MASRRQAKKKGKAAKNAEHGNVQASAAASRKKTPQEEIQQADGVPGAALPEAAVAQLFDEVLAFPGYQLTIDLERQVVVRPQGEEIPFEVQAFRKYCLQGGFDDIGLTLLQSDKIRAFEANRLATKPWLAHTLVS